MLPCPVNHHDLIGPEILRSREPHREDTFAATILGGPGEKNSGGWWCWMLKKKEVLGKFETTKTYTE